MVSYLKFAIVPVAAWLCFAFATGLRMPWRLVVRIAALFLAFTSTLCLLLLSPTGSIDISDLWLFLKFALVPLLVVLGFWAARFTKPDWVRKAIRILSSVAALPVGLLCLLFCFGELACTKRTEPIYSPDGKHVALVRLFLQGALGADSANVSLRRSWWPISEVAYRGGGAWDFKGHKSFSPKVQWLDNAHLLIRYFDGLPPHSGDDSSACKSAVGAIQIICENMQSTP